ncbi:hypothetical protein GGI43DRAFT_379634 [Trichoderma evansii]
MSPSLESTLINQKENPDLPLTDNRPSIKFWSANDHLVAVEIDWHADDSAETYGGTSKGTESKILNLDTNGVQRFGFGTKLDDVAPFKEDVGTGYLVAIAGTAGSALDSLGLLFISSEVKFEWIYNIETFDTRPSPGDIKSVVAIEQDYWNYTNKPMGWNFNRIKTYTSTQEWKKSRTEEFGEEASISGGFLGIEIGGGGSWSESTTIEHGRSWSETEKPTVGLFPGR